jgi:hypothetical protein
VTRWEERWHRASEAAGAAHRLQAPAVAVAVDENFAVVLDVSDGAARLLLLRRGAHGFTPWAEPIVEPLRGLGSPGVRDVSWIVGPAKVTEGEQSTWAVAGMCSEPPSSVNARVGPKARRFAVTSEFFVAMIACVPASSSEIGLSGLGPDASRALWSLALPAANLIAGTP